MAQLGMVPQKFRPKPNPLVEERKIDQMVPTEAFLNQHMANFYRGKMRDTTIKMREAATENRLEDEAYMYALGVKLDQYENASALPGLHREYVEMFNCWLLGKSPYNVSVNDQTERGKKLLEKTPWGTKPLFGPSIRAYLHNFIEEKYEFERQLTHLKMIIPQDIVSAWLYFKYIVCPQNWLPDEFHKDFAWWTESRDKNAKRAPQSVIDSRDNPLSAGDPGEECGVGMKGDHYGMNNPIVETNKQQEKQTNQTAEEMAEDDPGEDYEEEERDFLEMLDDIRDMYPEYEYDTNKKDQEKDKEKSSKRRKLDATKTHPQAVQLVQEKNEHVDALHQEVKGLNERVDRFSKESKDRQDREGTTNALIASRVGELGNQIEALNDRIQRLAATIPHIPALPVKQDVAMKEVDKVERDNSELTKKMLEEFSKLTEIVNKAMQLERSRATTVVVPQLATAVENKSSDIKAMHDQLMSAMTNLLKEVQSLNRPSAQPQPNLEQLATKIGEFLRERRSEGGPPPPPPPAASTIVVQQDSQILKDMLTILQEIRAKESIVDAHSRNRHDSSGSGAAAAVQHVIVQHVAAKEQVQQLERNQMPPNDHYRAMWERVKGESEVHQKRIAQLESEARTKDEEIARHRQELQAKASTIEAINKNTSAVSDEKAAISERLRRSESTLRATEENAKNLKDDWERDKESLQALEKKYFDLQRQHGVASAKLEEMASTQAKLGDAENKVRINENAKKNLEAGKRDLEAALSAARAKILESEAKNSKLQSAHEAEQQRVAMLVAETDRLKLLLESANSEKKGLAENKASLAHLQREFEDMKKERDELRMKNTVFSATLNNMLNSYRNNLAASEGLRETLRNMESPDIELSKKFEMLAEKSSAQLGSQVETIEKLRAQLNDSQAREQDATAELQRRFNELEKRREAYTGIEERLRQYQEREIEYKASLAKIKEVSERAEINSKELMELRGRLKDSEAEASRRKDEHEKELASAKSERREKMTALKRDKAELEEKLKSSEGKLGRTEEDLRTKEQQIAQAKKDYDETIARHKKSSEEQQEKALGKRRELEAHISELRKEKEALAAEATRAEGTKKKREGELRHQKEILQGKEKEMADLKEAHQIARARLEKELSDKEDDLKSLRENKRVLQTNLAEAKNKLDAMAQERQQELEDQARKHERQMSQAKESFEEQKREIEKSKDTAIRAMEAKAEEERTETKIAHEKALQEARLHVQSVTHQQRKQVERLGEEYSSRIGSAELEKEKLGEQARGAEAETLRKIADALNFDENDFVSKRELIGTPSWRSAVLMTMLQDKNNLDFMDDTENASVKKTLDSMVLYGFLGTFKRLRPDLFTDKEKRYIDENKITPELIKKESVNQAPSDTVSNMSKLMSRAIDRSTQPNWQASRRAEEPDKDSRGRKRQRGSEPKAKEDAWDVDTLYGKPTSEPAEKKTESVESEKTKAMLELYDYHRGEDEKERMRDVSFEPSATGNLHEKKKKEKKNKEKKKSKKDLPPSGPIEPFVRTPLTSF